MREAWLLLALLALPGCRYGYTRVGHDGFLTSSEELVAGESTALQVAMALGPPQSVTSRSGQLIYHYRFREIDQRSLIVRYFGGQWLQYKDQVELDHSLIVVFDRQDRLLYLAPSQNGS